ncbi:hypothetical protein [Dyella sp. 2RAB6]|uniref:hypothetical protein n=1 Tax=Dyella sp. 2RAB6 TaxID=3232992 RepID=UPI003F91E876
MKDQTRHRYMQGIDRAVALLQRAVDSGSELRDLRLFHHYLDDPEQTPEALLRTDIYLPLAWRLSRWAAAWWLAAA